MVSELLTDIVSDGSRSTDGRPLNGVAFSRSRRTSRPRAGSRISTGWLRIGRKEGGEGGLVDRFRGQGQDRLGRVFLGRQEIPAVELEEQDAELSLIHISEPTRQAEISYAVF